MGNHLVLGPLGPTESPCTKHRAPYEACRYFVVPMPRTSTGVTVTASAAGAAFRQSALPGITPRITRDRFHANKYTPKCCGWDNFLWPCQASFKVSQPQH